MPRPVLALLLLSCACSQKGLAAVDAGAQPAPLPPGYLGTTEPDALRPGSRPVDVALGTALRPCALLSSGEVWCWSLDAPAVLPGRVPGTWETRVDAIRAEGGRLLLHASGEYSLFRGQDTQRSADRRRIWYRHAPVALGPDSPTAWRCASGGSTCLVATARALRLIDDVTGAATAVSPPALCAGAAPDLTFAPDRAEEPWLLRCGPQAYLLAVAGGGVVTRPVTGLPAGARVVGWHGGGQAEVQAKDGTRSVYVADVSPGYTQVEWTGSAPQPFTRSADAAVPFGSATADVSPCTLDGAEVVCVAGAPPALAERARKLAASFPSAPRRLWTGVDVACAWGDVMPPQWALRCITVRDESPRDVAF